eukprot:scaffold6034_cov87-Skeletonema_dohrnii-CCMP3373.AAC.5
MPYAKRHEIDHVLMPFIAMRPERPCCKVELGFKQVQVQDSDQDGVKETSGRCEKEIEGRVGANAAD